MAIPVTSLHILRLLLQVDQNLSGLQRDMRQNAQTWKAQAQTQTVPVDTLATWMNDAATAYQTRLGWITTAQADATNWAKLASMWTKLGGTAQEFTDTISPMSAVANQLGPAQKTTYAQIVSACDQIIAAINAPLSLWPE